MVGIGTDHDRRRHHRLDPVAHAAGSIRAAGSCSTLVWVSPLGFLAVLAGWFTTEVGRQPWTVYGVLRTADAVSPVPGGSVLFSIILFVLVYGIVFGAGLYYIAKLVQPRTRRDAAGARRKARPTSRIGPWRRRGTHDQPAK